MTSEQKRDLIAALLREREGYSRAGKKDRVDVVDAELSRLGHESKVPAKRATKMVAKGHEEL
jgi:hypothetical protein